MSALPRDDLHRLIDALPDQHLSTARRVLGELAREPDDSPGAAMTIEELRASIGRPTAVVLAPPIQNIDQLVGDFWPDCEGPDEFDATIRRWRDTDRYSRLLD